jgi:DNA-directed RNA polymerase sigma subunit (sigma70/sigma32)
VSARYRSLGCNGGSHCTNTASVHILGMAANVRTRGARTTRASRHTPAEQADPALESTLEYQRLLASHAESGKISAAAKLATEPLRGIILNAAQRVHGHLRCSTSLDDVLADAYVITLEALSAYKPGRGTKTSTWVFSHLERNLLATSTRREQDRGKSIPVSWERLQRMIQPTREEFRAQYGRDPTIEELRDELEARCLDHHPGENPEKARDRLVRSGMKAALDNLSSVIAADRSPLSLNSQTHGLSEEPGGTLGDLLADPADQMATIFGPDSGLLGLACGHLDQKTREDLEQFAAGNAPPPDLRRHVRMMMARLRAPHAQYAYFAGVLSAAFETAEETSLPGDLIWPLDEPDDPSAVNKLLEAPQVSRFGDRLGLGSVVTPPINNAQR